MTSAAQVFRARPDGHGGVTLTPRFRFKDQLGTYIDPKDNIARSREIKDGVLTGAVRAATAGIKAANTVAKQSDEFTADADENQDDPTEQTIYVFGPLVEGQTCKLEKQPSGTIAVVVVSPPDELVGNTINSGGTTSAKTDTDLNVQGPTKDRRSQYLAGTLGGEARALANQNAINRRFYNR